VKSHPRVRTVEIQSLQDVPCLLAGYGSGPQPQKPQLRAEAAVFVPADEARPELGARVEGDDEGYTGDIAEGLDSAQEVVDISQSTEFTAVDGGGPLATEDATEDAYVPGQGQVAHITEAERHAAIMIANTYRKYQRFRKGRIFKGAAKLFPDFIAQSAKLAWPGPYYRLLFLGPIPHALFCINEIRERTRADKDKTKKKWKRARHQELEDMMKRLDTITWVSTAVQRS
jgi:hypothetical protein